MRTHIIPYEHRVRTIIVTQNSNITSERKQSFRQPRIDPVDQWAGPIHRCTNSPKSEAQWEIGRGNCKQCIHSRAESGCHSAGYGNISYQTIKTFHHVQSYGNASRQHQRETIDGGIQKDGPRTWGRSDRPTR